MSSNDKGAKSAMHSDRYEHTGRQCTNVGSAHWGAGFRDVGGQTGVFAVHRAAMGDTVWSSVGTGGVDVDAGSSLLGTDQVCTAQWAGHIAPWPVWFQSSKWEIRPRQRRQFVNGLMIVVLRGAKGVSGFRISNNDARIMDF